MRHARDLKVFAICSERDIAPGEARAFSLSRQDADGAARPFAIFVVHAIGGALAGYVNKCPHNGVWLNVGDGQFFDAARAHLRCGRHGALFEVESGACVEGPCLGAHLEPVAIVALDGEICLCGVDLVAESRRDDECDDTMEITIQSG